MANCVILYGTGEIGWNITWRPAGPFRIATELRNDGFSTQCVDVSFLYDRSSGNPFKSEFYHGILSKLLKKFINEETLWVGISTTYFSRHLFDVPLIASKKQDYTRLEKFIADCKELNPNLKFVIGGSRLYDFSSYGFYTFTGSADKEIVEFTRWCKDNMYKYDYEVSNQNVITCKEYDKFVTSNIRWSAEDCIMPGEALPIEISRGCIFKCKFCAFPMNGKTKGEWIKHADVLKEELIYNYTQFGTTHYIFADDTYNDSIDKIKFLLENVYSQLPFAVKFSAYLRLDLLMRFPESVEILRDSGLISASFGIETNNLESSKAIGKGVAFERQIEFLQKIKQGPFKDITIQSGFIVGLPHDTHDSINDLKEFLRSNKNPLDAWSVAPLGINATLTGVHKNYYSEFDLEYKDHGYIIKGQDTNSKNPFAVNWELPSADLDYNKCTEYASEMNAEARTIPNYKVAGHGYIMLKNLFGIHEMELYQKYQKASFSQLSAERDLLLRIIGYKEKYYRKILDL
jgi:hypothetical protein